ncbi:hypothetical protein CA606_09180 [Caulobacter vibrioides]|uniref:Uncharacterized protein n=2 Tax=Caulobacter vibrioides TaxID=155892 RepID=A0A290MKB6_CAUVI|nr:hypothetical protein CA606_09180 [Caulobacter vibrioides]
MMEKYAHKGVVAIATIPETVFSDLAKLGASLGDFVALLRQLPNDGAKLDELQIRNRFRDLHRDTFSMIEATLLTQDGRTWMDGLLSTLLGVRAEMSKGGEEIAKQRMAQVYADVGFKEIVWLGAASLSAIQAIEAVPIGQVGPRQIVGVKTFGVRTHAVAVAPLPDAPALFEAPQLASAKATGLIVSVALSSFGRSVLLATPRDATPTNISQEIQKLIEGLAVIA